MQHLVRFYSILGALETKIGARPLKGCSGRMYWPRRCVYFFREAGENRSGTAEDARIVRVGTHALKSCSHLRDWEQSKDQLVAWKEINDTSFCTSLGHSFRPGRTRHLAEARGRPESGSQRRQAPCRKARTSVARSGHGRRGFSGKSEQFDIAALVQICARERKKASGGVKTTRRVLHSRLQGQFGS